ncbi:MAG: hypothetical protein HY758_03975 [Nitrospirae bacterium]|nr:hypothetical protein [Nitrospirota bacterium]
MKLLSALFAAILLVMFGTLMSVRAEGTPGGEISPPAAFQKITYEPGMFTQEDEKYVLEENTYRAELSGKGFKFIKKSAYGDYSFEYRPGSLILDDDVLWACNEEMKPLADGKRAIYILTKDIKEIYEAKKGGIEQSWLIESKPANLSGVESPDSSLIIEGEIITDLKTREDRNRGIDFMDAKGNLLFSYGKVHARDKTGKTLEVLPSISTTEKDKPLIRILVSAKWLSEAEYPVVIDPFIGSTFYGSETLIG